MILLQSFYRFFLSTTITLVLAIVVTFGFGVTESGATNLPLQLITQPQAQLAAMNRVQAAKQGIEDKAKDVLDSITGDSKTQTNGNTQQSEAKTQEAIDSSIENPNYQPGGQTKQAKDQDQSFTKTMESKVREGYGK